MRPSSRSSSAFSFAEKEPDGLLFVVCVGREKGAPFRRTSFGRNWAKARSKVGLPKDFRFYDLRHTTVRAARQKASPKPKLAREALRAPTQPLGMQPSRGAAWPVIGDHSAPASSGAALDDVSEGCRAPRGGAWS